MPNSSTLEGALEVLAKVAPNRVSKSCVCPSCGAGASTGNQHDPDCLVNIPGKHELLSPFWKAGWNTYLKHHVDSATMENVSELQAKTFAMGLRCAAMMIKKLGASKVLPMNIISIRFPDECIQIESLR